MDTRVAGTAAAMIAGATNAWAQTAERQADRAEVGVFGLPAAPIDEPLVTDRPDFTESALTVPVGRVQVEAGFTLTRDGDESEYTLPETLLRFGVAEDWEIRLELPSVGFVNNGVDEEGLTDMSVGFKWQFVEQEGNTPDVALLGFLTLPTGDDPFGEDGAQPGAILAAGWDLSEAIAEGWSLGVNAGFVEADNPAGDSVLDTQWSAAVGIPIDDEFGAYAEYFAVSPGSTLSDTEHSFNTGLTWLVNPNLQFDVRVGFGLNDDAPDFFTGAGVSVRF